MTREEAYRLVTEWTQNFNLVKHMLAVEAIMRALARHFKEDEELWGIVGLVHDADYEMFKHDPQKHPSRISEELKKRNCDPRIIQAVQAHGWQSSEVAQEPQSQLDWSLYCCDELSGFIIACALVRPDKKLASVTAESVLKKFPVKAFAAAVDREHIKLCEKKLGIPLAEFIQIALMAMQGISAELGL